MSIFDAVKSNISILDVVREYTALKKAGSYWKGQCPFHDEKTASFTVSPHREIFYCFGCHVSGDVISFIARKEQCSPLEAARYLAERYSVQVAEEPNASIKIQERQHYYTICQVVAEWCHAQLLEHKDAYAYFQHRGITQNSIDQFMLGYFPGGSRSIKLLFDYARKHNVLQKDLHEVHIISESKNVVYSPFEERLMFPIRDHLGRYCGFGGRIFKDGDTRAKYYNSRENEFFTKGALLFGLDVAKTAIQKEEYVFIVEGYTDCIAMVQHGYSHTVATLGTACTLPHLKQLSRYADRVYVMYDGDKAGQQAMLRLTQLCWQVSMELKVINLPSGTDPFSFLTKGGSVQQLLQDARDIFIFFIDSVGKTFVHKSLAKKLEIIKALLEAISALDDPLKQDLLLQEAARTLDISFMVLKQELDRITGKDLSQGQKDTPKNQKGATDTISDLLILEKKLVCAILNNASLLDKIDIQYLITYLSRPLNDIISLFSVARKRNSDDSFRCFFDTLNEKQQQYVSKLVLEEEPQDKGSFESLYLQWQRRQWKSIVTDIKTKITQARDAGDENTMRTLLDEFAQLKQVMMQGDHSQGIKKRGLGKHYDN